MSVVRQMLIRPSSLFYDIVIVVFHFSLMFTLDTLPALFSSLQPCILVVSPRNQPASAYYFLCFPHSQSHYETSSFYTSASSFFQFISAFYITVYKRFFLLFPLVATSHPNLEISILLLIRLPTVFLCASVTLYIAMNHIYSTSSNTSSHFSVSADADRFFFSLNACVA